MGDPVMAWRDPEAKRLAGKNALVTAGTQGIGLAIVERLAQEGARVFLCSRKEANVKAAVDALRAKGLDVEGTACNVGAADDLERYVREGLAFFGEQRIDVLVSNAGVNPTAGPTLEMPDAVYDKIMNINVRSYWHLVKLARPCLAQGASVIFVSSVGGHQPAPPLGLYGVSKTAVIALGRVLAQDLGQHGIRVNTICPGIIRTKMSAVFWKDSSESQERKSSWLQRYGDPVDVGGLAAFLASRDSAFITGESFVVSGGTASRM